MTQVEANTQDAPVDPQPKPAPTPALHSPQVPDSGGAPIALHGRLRPTPLGRLGRGLVYGTGLFLLRPVWILVRYLISWRRHAVLELQDGQLRLESEQTVLGTRLQQGSERILLSRLVSVANETRTTPEPLALGALALIVGLVWGLLRVVDGLYGRSAGLVLLGLGAMAAGTVVDLAILWAARHLPNLTRHGVVLHLVDGRTIAVDGVPESSAKRLVDTLSARLG